MTTATVKVKLPGHGGHSYNIHIGRDILPHAAKDIARLAGAGRVAIVCDETVGKLYGSAVWAALHKAGASPFTVALPPGEESKSLAALEDIYAQFAAEGFGRDGVVAALGGGVIGDVAGFAAATWMRGVPVVQLPTTLLAQVDSSVGGKTGINLPDGKNLVGAFHQPALVVANTAWLQTLPERELRCGLAEVVKYGALFSPPLLEKLSAPVALDDLPPVIEECCRLKAKTVQADERDTGLRMVLNFGHSFGHGIEKLGGYRAHNHGEAVAMGMVLAAGVGQRTGLTAAGCKARLAAALGAQGLPTRCPYPASALAGAMALDKKGHNGGLNLILLKDIGQAEIVWHSMAQVKGLLAEELCNG